MIQKLQSFIPNLYSHLKYQIRQYNHVAPFHLAFPIADKDFKKTRHFYEELLQCGVGKALFQYLKGRIDPDHWIDYNFFGHQITGHYSPEECVDVARSDVDGDKVPVRHFGAVLEWSVWEELAARLKQNQTKFIIEPHIRFKGQVGEQGTMFIRDPSGNAIEFKTFKDFQSIFAS